MSSYLGLTPLQRNVLGHYSQQRLPLLVGGSWGTSVRALMRRRMLIGESGGFGLTEKGRAALARTTRTGEE